MRLIRIILLSVLLLVPVVALHSAPAQASALSDSACTGAGNAVGTGAGCDNGTGLQNGFKTVANTLIFLVGAISVIMIIIGALRYVLAGGDASGLKGAKDTIMYALVGLVVAILSYAMVSYVISRFV